MRRVRRVNCNIVSACGCGWGHLACRVRWRLKIYGPSSPPTDRRRNTWHAASVTSSPPLPVLQSSPAFPFACASSLASALQRHVRLCVLRFSSTSKSSNRRTLSRRLLSLSAPCAAVSPWPTGPPHRWDQSLYPKFHMRPGHGLRQHTSQYQVRVPAPLQQRKLRQALATCPPRVHNCGRSPHGIQTR